MRKTKKTDERKRLLSGSSVTDNHTLDIVISTPELTVNSNYGTLPDQQDSLLSLTQYYLILERNNDIKYNVGKYILLTVISGTSIWLFGTTGGLAAGNDLVLRILLISGGTSLNFCTTFNTSEAFLDYIRSNRVPPELKKFLKSKSNKLELFAIGGAAFLSAGPVTLAVFSDAKKITTLVITEAVVTQIDNSFIHTFPTLLIAKIPLLRAIFSLPFLPIILCYKFYKHIEHHCFLSEEEIHLRKVQERKEHNHAKIKTAMIDTLETARQQILNQTFKFHWNRQKPWEAQYKINLPSDLKKIRELNDITPLIRIASHAPQIQDIPQSTLCSKVTNFFVNTLVGGVFYTFGVGLGNFGISGFYKNAYDDSVDIGNYTHSYFNNSTMDFSNTEAEAWGWGLSSPPNVLAAVLVGYFAGRFFKHTVYDSFISCLRGQYNAPQGFKRYPKTTTLLIGLAFFLAKYGYGTALYLDQTHFQDARFDDIRPFLFFCAKYGVSVFLFKNTIEVILNQAVKYARFFGDDDNKASADLDAKILALENAIQNADGDELEQSLQNRSTEQRKALLRMSEEEFQQLLDHSPEQEIKSNASISLKQCC